MRFQSDRHPCLGVVVLCKWSSSGALLWRLELTVVARTVVEASVTSRAANRVCGTSAVFFQ
jgi:hypothetical protein